MNEGTNEGLQPRRDEVIIGIQSAIALWTYEGNLIWSKFNAMLVANSVVVVAAGTTINVGSWSLSVVIPLAGMVLCTCWWLLTERGFDNYRYWIEVTKELEAHLHPAVNIARRGGHFAEGATVTFSAVGADPVILSMSRRATFMRARTAAVVVIGVFFTVNVILAVAALT